MSNLRDKAAREILGEVHNMANFENPPEEDFYHWTQRMRSLCAEYSRARVPENLKPGGRI